MDNIFDTLLAFFKALADANRLKIIGLLAQKESSVEELAAMLDISASTVSHHLSKLADIGLVSARAEGYYNIYRLETKTLEEMAQRLLSGNTLPEVAKNLDTEAYERRLLEDCLAEDGAIVQFPTNKRKQDVILRYAAEHFDDGKVYTEKEVNVIIGELYGDIPLLRRYLISFGYLDRERDGSAYWRVAQKEEKQNSAGQD